MSQTTALAAGDQEPETSEPAAKLFSVVTIVRNNLDGLRLTSDSVIAQTCRDFEWIIVDGASADGTKALVDTLRAHADIVISEPDAGIYDAMNKGLRRASGEYVLFLNAGDLFAGPDVLRKVAEAVAAAPRRAAMLVCAAEFRIKGDRYWVQSPRDMKHIWHSVPTSHQAMLVRTSLHKRYLFNTALKIAADYDAIARMSLVDSSALLIDVILSRVWRGTDSNSIRKPLAGIRDMAHTQREVLKLPRGTIAYSAIRRFFPLMIVHLVEMPVISPLAFRAIRLLRPRRSAETR